MLLQAYKDLLTESISVQQEIANILSAQTREPSQAKRDFVTENPPITDISIIKPTMVSEVIKPITQQRPNNIRHYNLTTKSTINEADTLQLQGVPLWMIINNIDPTNDIQLSFDDKKTYFEVPNDSALNFTPFTIPEALNHLYFRSDDAASVSFQILSGEL